MKDFTLDDLFVSLSFENRFYASLFTRLSKVSSKHVPTAAVGFNKSKKLTLFYNPTWLFKLTFREAKAVIKHELGHIIFKHLTRMPVSIYGDKVKRNIAADIAINPFISGMPEGVLYPDQFDLPNGECAEFYYDNIDSNKGKDSFDDHTKWGQQTDEEGNFKPMSVEDIEEADDTINDAVRKAASSCNSDDFSSLPASMQKAIDEILSASKYNWRSEFRVFVNSFLSTRRRLSNKRVNRRFAGKSFFMPGKKKAKDSKILIARDTSGSCVDEETQKQFITEIKAMMKHSKLLVADCDTEIQQVIELKSICDLTDIKGGGGTDFRPVFELAKKTKVDGVVYLTDTYGSFPEREEIGKYASSTLWVTFGQKEADLPFGKHVNIEGDRNE